MLGELDDFCVLVIFFDGANGGCQVFKIMFYFKVYGYFVFFTLWGYFDENIYFVGFFEGYNVTEGNKYRIRQVISY